MQKKIWHIGAWAGNFGDSIIQQSIKNNLVDISNDELEFYYLNCQQTEFTEELINQLNNEADLMILGGGGLVFYRPQDDSKSGWQWNIDINLIDKIKVPLVVYGIGYNQFEYDQSDFLPITNEHLKKTVEKAALFSVRNFGTKRELIKRGCNGDKIEVIPDSGMFAKSQPIEIPGLDQGKIKLGINWTTDRENQTFPEPWEKSKLKFLKELTKFLNYATSEKNAQIIYIGHMGHDFDAWIIDYFKNHLITRLLIIDEVLSELYPPGLEKSGFLVDIYRQMDLVLGMRGHANIVAFGQNTPMIGMGSHRKIRYFLEDINRSEYFFDVRPKGSLYNFEKMKNLLDDVINNNEKHRQDIKHQFNLQKNIFIEFNKKVINLFKLCNL